MTTHTLKTTIYLTLWDYVCVKWSTSYLQRDRVCSEQDRVIFRINQSLIDNIRSLIYKLSIE